MHAQKIIQEFLAKQCPSMHAKRRDSLALMTDAARRGGVSLIRMSKSIRSDAPLRHRIKRCDRLLSNPHLAAETVAVYRALAHHVLRDQAQVGIIVDWSDLLTDISQHVLRAALVVQGRAIVLYEEVHPTAQYGAEAVHRAFMETLRSVLPAQCQPIIITDAGFRGTWFNMLDQLGFAWIGRIRNRDTVCADGQDDWQGCKQLYADTGGRVRDLGLFQYTRRHRLPCRLVLIKRKQKGRKRKTAFGKKSTSAHSKKQATGQREPWLLAASHRLAALGAKVVVALYERRMQIEQTFRDLKDAQWGMGLRYSQTRKPARLAILLLIGALLGYLLWLIGLAAKASGYCISYGSRKKAASTLSILSLARHWLDEFKQPRLSQLHLREASRLLAAMVMTYKI